MDLRPLVIYHANCADGVAAAWCFWKKFGDMMEYIPGSYDVPLEDFEERDVYFVDFSAKRHKMEHIIATANQVVLLDHHVSALNDLKGLQGIDMTNCTIEKSGAGIAWEYNFPGREMPKLLQHIQDRDLWRFEMKHTAEVMSWVFSHKLDISAMELLVQVYDHAGNRGEIIGRGIAIMRKFDLDLQSIIEQCSRRIEIAGYNIPVANANGMFASELGNRLSVREPFAGTYFDTAEGRKWSLRSQKDGADVSEIARLYGGGGHKNAAGFFVPYTHYLARI